MNTNTIIAGSSSTLEAAIISGLQERRGAKIAVVSEAEVNRKALFAELDALREDLILVELEDNLLAARQMALQSDKKAVLSSLSNCNAQLAAEKDQPRLRAMRGARGRIEGNLNALAAELGQIYKERGEVLATIKQIRATRTGLKKELNAFLAVQPKQELASPERVSQLAVKFNKGMEQMEAAA